MRTPRTRRVGLHACLIHTATQQHSLQRLLHTLPYPGTQTESALHSLAKGCMLSPSQTTHMWPVAAFQGCAYFAGQGTAPQTSTSRTASAAAY